MCGTATSSQRFTAAPPLAEENHTRGGLPGKCGAEERFLGGLVSPLSAQATKEQALPSGQDELPPGLQKLPKPRMYSFPTFSY